MSAGFRGRVPAPAAATIVRRRRAPRDTARFIESPPVSFRGMSRAQSREPSILYPMPDPVDAARLRTGRLARLQAALRARDIDACLLFNEPNVRYATGASAMPIWSNTTFVRCALVPAEGRPILYEHPNSMHLFRGLESDVRPMHAWEFYDDTEAHARTFARETAAALSEIGAGGRPLAVDRLGTPGCGAAESTSPPAPSVRARTPTPGAPRPPRASSNRVTWSTSTPTLWGSKGIFSACRARSCAATSGRRPPSGRCTGSRTTGSRLCGR